MALQTHIHLAFRRHAFRVCDVLRGRSMAALAVDPLWQALAKDGAAGIAIVHAGRICIVAEEAARVDDASELVMSRTVVAGTHSPSLFLRVPGDRQLRQLPRCG